MKKKLVSLILTAAMVLSLGACGQTGGETASCIYTQKGNKKIRKPQAVNQTALIFARRVAARLLSDRKSVV